MLSDYFSRDMVIKLLVRKRCKYADKQADIAQRSEFIIYPKNINSETSNTSVTKRQSDKIIIYSLFPARSKWCHLGRSRTQMDSVKRNETKLYNTYLSAKKQNSTEQWYVDLCNFADQIVYMGYNPGISIPSPTVHVLEKKRNNDSIICRPVCSFSLKVKIVLSLLNKYLTNVLDEYFLDCSLAFRKPTPERGNFQHLNAVKIIKQYREKYIGESLFVAECDLQKFYDTIDHNIIKSRFNQLINKVKKKEKISHSELKIVKKWFYCYVDCFDFYNNVYRLNKYDSMHKFWHSIPNREGKKCEIEWISKFVVKGKYMISKRKRLGVPQGGPLSGCIANIVMHYVDKAIIKSIGEKDILYIRYCDDMILVGNDKDKVAEVFGVYRDVISKSKLHAHSEHNMTTNKMADFWKGKTRETYEWNQKGENIFPWITFVGFDINWNGNLRIRKSTYKKQIVKQHNVCWELLKQYRNGRSPRYCAATIRASLLSRQIGMSVGRVNLWNYLNNPNIHSWASAFSILDENKWSAKQLKALDRHRQKVLHRTDCFLANLECPAVKKNTERKDNPNINLFYSGKPYSYYGQCFTYK